MLDFLLKELSKINQNNPGISSELYTIALHLINRFDEIDRKEQSDNSERASVLIFLPGIHEIIEMDTVLKDQWNNVYVTFRKRF